MIMKSFVLGCAIVSCLLTVSPVAWSVSGEFQIINGVRVLNLWGTYSDMGYAHGYLLGTEIMDVVNQYMMPMIGAAAYQQYALPLYRQWFDFPDDYLEEVTQIRNGMIAAGTDLTITQLGRDLTVEDLCVMNCVVDLTQFMSTNADMTMACSSVNGWGDGTEIDPYLPRGLIHCRDLDWSDTASHLLGRKSVIMAYSPSDSRAQAWIAISFPGFVGCLSGMNRDGVGATLNVGNYKVNPGSATSMQPICIQLRSALEIQDPNQDGRSDAEDVYDYLDEHARAPSTIITAFGPSLSDARLDPPALVVESNHTGIAKRLPSHDPELGPDFLAATNYHRLLYTPQSCYRYDQIKARVNEDRRLTAAEAWSIEQDVHLAWTLQTMLFRPDIREVWFASTVNATPAPFNTPARLNWGDLFPGTPTPTAAPGEPTHTPHPPTATASPFPATATPTPLASQTAQPSPTPTSGSGSIVFLFGLNADFFQPGDPFLLTYQIQNSTPSDVSAALWIILDVYSQYWFYPGWTQTAEYDAQALGAGADTGVRIVFDFDWPQTDSHADGLMFWSALTTPDTFELITEVKSAEFGF